MDDEYWFSNEWSTNDTHRLVFTVSPFLVLHYDTMDLGNGGIGDCNIPMNIRNDYICVYCKLRLEVGGQRSAMVTWR